MWVERIADRPGLVAMVAEKMREADRREIFATRFEDDPMAVARDAEAVFGRDVGWVSGLGDNPIAAFGCFQMWPGVWSMWLFATDDFGQIGISMTKLIVRDILPMLFDAGAHRLEARSIEGNDDVQRWLELLGARRETTLKGYGREGQNFHVYIWDRR